MRHGASDRVKKTGGLPASIVVKLAPFNRDTLQHFIFLERPADSTEPDGAGFVSASRFTRGNRTTRHTPMVYDYSTVGEFYASLKGDISRFVAEHGEDIAFAGDRALQLQGAGFGLPQARPVLF